MAMRSRRRHSATEGGSDPYWISFSDLMSALLVIFILAVVVLILQLTEQGQALAAERETVQEQREDRKSTRLNSSHVAISYAVVCVKKKKQKDEGMENLYT